MMYEFNIKNKKIIKETKKWKINKNKNTLNTINEYMQIF